MTCSKHSWARDTLPASAPSCRASSPPQSASTGAAPASRTRGARPQAALTEIELAEHGVGRQQPRVRFSARLERPLRGRLIFCGAVPGAPATIQTSALFGRRCTRHSSARGSAAVSRRRLERDRAARARRANRIQLQRTSKARRAPGASRLRLARIQLRLHGRHLRMAARQWIEHFLARRGSARGEQPAHERELRLDVGWPLRDRSTGELHAARRGRR